MRGDAALGQGERDPLAFGERERLPLRRDAALKQGGETKRSSENERDVQAP